VAALPLADVVLRDTVISATSASSYRQYVAMDAGNTLVGRAGDITAIAAIEFYPSYFPIRDTALVYKATLRLRMEIWSGDANGQLSFTVHRIQRSWSSSTLTWDSVQTAFYDPVVRGSYSGTLSADTEMVSVDLDTAMVREWIRTQAGGSTLQYGIALVPTSSSTLIRGFRAFGYDSAAAYPQVVIVAGSATGAARDTTTYSYGIDTFAGNVDNPASDPTLLVCQAGVTYRSQIEFPVAFIPRGAIVNRAQLIMQRDPVTSRLTKFSSDSSAAANLITASGAPPTFESGFAAGTRQEGTASTIVFDVRRAVQAWVKGTNYGLVLRVPPGREYSSVDRITFFGPAAPENLRPRLRITYTIPK
jgi:hypothetical protein